MIPAVFGTHWRTNSLMVGFLVAGILLAIGHDLFYASLDGTLAPADEDYKIGNYLKTSKQQFNLNVGNALATFVETCLMMAISSAFVQSFWRLVRTNPPPVISRLNTLYAASTDFMSFWHVKLWGHAPILFLLALIAWVVPLLTIFTPGTVSVSLQPQRPPVVPEHRVVPNLDFRSLVFSQDMVLNGADNYMFGGASQQVLKVAEAVAKGNALLRVSPPALNSTWAVSFDGPSLRCGEVTGDDRHSVFTNIAEWTKLHCNHPSGYLSWLQKRSNDRIELPYVLGSPEPAGFDGGASSLYDDNANVSLYIATVPTLLNFKGASGAQDLDQACSDWKSDASPVSPLASFRDTSLTRCDLVNTTYNITFKFANGTQEVELPPVANQDAEVLKAVTSVRLYSQSGTTCVQTGSLDLDPKHCIFDNNLLRRIAYQSVFVAFDSLVRGRVTRNDDGSIDTSTGVSVTALADTTELAYLNDAPSEHSGSTLESVLAQANTQHSRGLSHAPSEAGAPGSGPLAAAMQELFRNITISLMSSQDLLPDNSSWTAPKEVEVTFTSWQPTYMYARGRLWLFYGVAIGLATIATMVGTGIIWVQNEAHNEKLSDVLGICARYEHSIEDWDSEYEHRGLLPVDSAKIRVSLSEGHHSRGQSVGGSDILGDSFAMDDLSSGMAYSPVRRRASRIS